MLIIEFRIRRDFRVNLVTESQIFCLSFLLSQLLQKHLFIHLTNVYLAPTACQAPIIAQALRYIKQPLV